MRSRACASLREVRMIQTSVGTGPCAAPPVAAAFRARNDRIGSMTQAAAACLALLVVALAFLPALSAGWIWDDRADVLDNPAATPAGFAAALGTTNRPLIKATYALQRAWTGDDPRPFHVANLLLHLAAAAAVARLARRVLPASGRAAELVAWGAAVLWAIHPAAVEAVAPVSGRSALLSSLLVVATLLLVTAPAPPRRLGAVAAALCACAAPLAKETALVLPALLALWQATLGVGEPRARALSRWRPLLLGWAAALGAIAASDRHRELVAFSLAERSPLDALRGNLFALFELAGLWLAPASLSIDPPAPVALPWTAPATLARLALFAAVVGAVVVLRRRRPAVAFALGWTVLALVPSNSVIWRLDPVAPRALYLASIGPLLLLALGALGSLPRARVAGDPPGSRLGRRTVAALVAGCFAALALTGLAATQARAALYADPVELWADAARKAPGSPRPWLNLGVALLLSDRIDEAEVALAASHRLDPLETRTGCALDAVRIRRSANRFDPERRDSP